MAIERLCSVEGCDKKHYGRGYCSVHHRRFHYYGDPLGSTSLISAKGKQCSIEECDKPVKTKGFCRKHYYRWLTHGDPRSGGSAKAPAGEPARFFYEQVLTYQGDACLIWPYAKPQGYGTMMLDGKVTLVSRLVCEAVHGPAPADKALALHSCGRGHEGCVTRRHLRWGNDTDNTADKIIHGTHAKGTTHGRARLSESDVLSIRKLAKTKSNKEIGEMFGIKKNSVWFIVKRVTWKHI